MKKKVDNPNVRQTIASALSVFIISLIVFALAYKLSVIPYLTIVACCAGLVCVYARTINVVRLDRTLQTTIAFAANILAFLIIKLVNGRSFRQIPTDRWVAIFILMMIIAAETAYIVHSTRNYAKKDYTEEAYRAGRKESGDRIRFNEDTLLPSRESDYEKLRQLILKNNIVGAEGEWGSGKSYIVDSLTEELKESGFEVVPLKMFELNTDDVVSVFLWTIDNLLRKHGIATRHSRILSRMVDGNKYLADFQNALFPDYEITVFYYNPCITDTEEYMKRRESQIRFIEAMNRQHEAPEDRIRFADGDRDTEEYFRRVRGLEQEPEGGARCTVCFRQRLEESARYAKEHGFPLFTTTLTVSPHKDYPLISGIGKDIARETEGVEFLDIDFKKKAGFQRSVALSKEYGLYRQNFCGCEFSRRV